MSIVGLLFLSLHGNSIKWLQVVVQVYFHNVSETCISSTPIERLLPCFEPCYLLRWLRFAGIRGRSRLTRRQRSWFGARLVRPSICLWRNLQTIKGVELVLWGFCSCHWLLRHTVHLWHSAVHLRHLAIHRRLLLHIPLHSTVGRRAASRETSKISILWRLPSHLRCRLLLLLKPLLRWNVALG